MVHTTVNWWWRVCVVLLVMGGTVQAVRADEVVERARALADVGKFAEAETLLHEKIADPDGPVVGAAAVELEILRRDQAGLRIDPRRPDGASATVDSGCERSRRGKLA